VTGLSGISAQDYEFFDPRDGDPGSVEWARAAASNRGLPGQDPYPLLDGSGGIRLCVGEQLLGEWGVTTIARSLKAASTGRPTPAGEWVREELVTRGKAAVQLTSLRVAVVVPGEYVNQLDPRYPRGQAPVLRSSLKDRLLMRSASRVAPGWTADLLGDLSPRAGHVALDNIESLSCTQGDADGMVTIHVSVAGSAPPPARIASLYVELHATTAHAVSMFDGIVDAARTRWLGLDLPAPLRAAVEQTTAESTSTGGREYVPPLFRPIGSRTVLVCEWARERHQGLPEELPASEDLLSRPASTP
jgi:hypothetical protein